MSVYRYINNTDTDITVDAITVPANDQIITNVEVPELNSVGLLVLVNGIAQEPDTKVTEVTMEKLPKLDLEQKPQEKVK